MEKKLLKYTMILIIFFIGLSMGVSYRENNATKNLQNQLKDFEDNITSPNNDFKPVNPKDTNATGSTIVIKNNIFTKTAKGGESLIRNALELVLDKSDELFKFIFNTK